MNVLALLKSLATRAARMEEEAKDLRADALQIQTLLFGGGDQDVTEDEAPIPEAPPKALLSRAQVAAPAAAPAAPAVPQMPNRDEIRAKAAEFGVDVDDLLPLGKKPTLQAKQDALKRILAAKKDAATKAPFLVAVPDEDDVDLSRLG